MKRKVYKKLLKWKESNTNTALIINGANGVGKTYISKKFGSKEYNSYIYINFSKQSSFILKLFKRCTSNVDIFFSKLSKYFNTTIYIRNTLFIFDEVQYYPHASELTKLLVDDGRYDYILIGPYQTNYNNNCELRVTMYPLDFEEFLWALDQNILIDAIKDSYHNNKSMGEITHRHTMMIFRQYLLLGGMPQVINSFIKNNDYLEAHSVKMRILNLYRSDITKYAKGYEDKVLDIFDNIPNNLSTHDKRFNVSSIKKNARMRSYIDSFVWLSDAMITNVCFKATEPNYGIKLNKSNSAFKCYLMDTGLLVSHVFSSDPRINHDIFSNILFDKLGINEGMIIENIVAQTLATNGYDLFYYNNNTEHLEIDFLITKDGKASPIEVKSSNYKRHRSLDKFKEKYKKKIGKQYVVYTNDLYFKDNVTYLPIYMTWLL